MANYFLLLCLITDDFGLVSNWRTETNDNQLNSPEQQLNTKANNKAVARRSAPHTQPSTSEFFGWHTNKLHLANTTSNNINSNFINTLNSQANIRQEKKQNYQNNINRSNTVVAKSNEKSKTINDSKHNSSFKSISDNSSVILNRDLVDTSSFSRLASRLVLQKPSKLPAEAAATTTTFTNNHNSNHHKSNITTTTINQSQPYLQLLTSNNHHLTTEHDSTSVTSFTTRDMIEKSQFIVEALILGLIILITFVGNILVCLSVIKVRKLRHPSNYLLISLAISDLCVACIVMPFGLYQSINDKWQLGRLLCNVYVVSDVTSCTASILNLCVISIDRYLAITRPLTYCVERTTRLMLILIASVWICACLISGE